MKTKLEELEEENQRLKEDLNRIQSISEKQTKRKKGVFKFIGHSLAGKRLKKSIYNVLDQYTVKRNVTRDAISDLLASVLYRVTRIGLFTLIFAILPSVLLIQQNILLKQQNRKIQDQNYLAEASRRSGQMFIMGDVLSDINSELKNSSRLSPTLIGRIASLSRAMKPYRYFENDALIKNPMSPERGQLLITLSKSELSKSQLTDGIFQNSDFTYAELSYTNLQNAFLQEIDLSHANLKHADLVNSNLSFAALRHANLFNVDLHDAQLRLADLSHANLTNANLMFTELTNTNFTATNLERVRVHRMDWLTYIRDELKLEGAEELTKKYKVDSLYFEDFNRKVPTIIKR